MRIMICITGHSNGNITRVNREIYTGLDSISHLICMRQTGQRRDLVRVLEIVIPEVRGSFVVITKAGDRVSVRC